MKDTQDDKTRLQGEKEALGSWRALGEKYGVNHKFPYEYCTHGTMPPRKIARKLGIVSEKLLATRARRATLNAIAKDKGFASWSAYETAQIKEWRNWE